MVLYKYLPSRFAAAFVERGEILFRSLSYFRQVEHTARGDAIEGLHIDAPRDPPTLQNLTTGATVRGPFRFLNSIDQDRVYALCCSRTLSLELMQAFDCDACVRIVDVELFFLRCSVAAARSVTLCRPGLIHRPVSYFDPAGSAILPVKDPTAIPFFKHKVFAGQDEYRAVFAQPGGFRLLERIVMPGFSFDEEIKTARPSERLLRIGPLRGIAEFCDPPAKDASRPAA